MIFVTKILKKTVGEDNRRTEMQVVSYLNRSLAEPCFQVHDCQSKRENRIDCFCRCISKQKHCNELVENQKKKADKALVVLALEYGDAGLHPCRISLRSGRTLLVCCWLQPYDCLFRCLGYLVQEEDSGSSHTVGNCQNSLW